MTAALAIILIARSTMHRVAYVSELGAVGEPTARWFEAALLLIVVGGSLIAWTGRGVRSRARLLGLWTPAISLWIGCAFFLGASQVTCTAGCPLPVGPTFTPQNFAHTLMAVLAFAAACTAMLQSAFAHGHRMLARLSLAAGISVAVVAATGGILSLMRFGTDVGSVLELVATAISIGWLVVFGLTAAAGSARTGAVPASAAGADAARLGAVPQRTPGQYI
ncbi:MAG: DUF998 domain-containing protein [Microbacteriaceae bacterium]|nr:DUF998 domain-containing protein [Microbacteriaceae bacterium]